MAMGGLLAYSKKHILDHIDQKYRINYIFFKKNRDSKDIDGFLKKQNLTYPLIAKPDSGERGKNVVKIHSKAELTAYLKVSKHDLIIQQYIDYPIELGILYHYDPQKKTSSNYICCAEIFFICCRRWSIYHFKSYY